MTLTNKQILISGAGIAGPTLAYWLARYGFTPIVIERTPALRARPCSPCGTSRSCAVS